MASSRGFDSILSALMCFTAIEAAREKISPSSAFGPLIGRLAPTLIVSWAIAPPAHSSVAAMAAAILDLSMNVLPCVARVRAIFVFGGLTFRRTGAACLLPLGAGYEAATGNIEERQSTAHRDGPLALREREVDTSLDMDPEHLARGV